ncbi:MAG: ROK family protein [Acidobacteria bacterium]|nr:ROK family protein [Acidobacteriota bacterium]
MNTSTDPRIVMILDAGGTNLKFSAIRSNQLLLDPIYIPSEADNLERCLGNMIEGFRRVREQLPEAPAAISFAFPGPADYPAGIVANENNLPAFRGGVALGPMLADEFGIPTFINNDGDLFVYGEAMSGFLPYVNGLLAEAGSPKRYKNLFGITLGTGLGGGIVRDGQLFIGDNSMAAEVWLSRNIHDASINAEEGASIRAVRRVYARSAGIALEAAPEPKEIFEIGMGRGAGNREAAKEAFRCLGQAAGDVVAQALTLVDGLAVIGGGISAAAPLFMPALMKAVNGVYERDGNPLRRVIAKAFDIDNAVERGIFLQGEARSIAVPRSGRMVQYDPLQRVAVGLARLDTSEAVALGAYAFALSKL